MDGIAFNASLHSWAFFVTLTFDSKDECGNAKRVPGYGDRQKMLFAFLREVAKGNKRNKQGKRIESVNFPSLLFLARDERGELRGRNHFHILLDGLPPTRKNLSECNVMKAIWKGLRGGHADCRLFDTRLKGVTYVMKGLEQWSRVHANAYEMAKFTEDEKDRMLILSDSCARKWAQESYTTKASLGSRDAVITGARSLFGRKAESRKTTKEELEVMLRRSVGLNMHPAGASFVV